MEWINKYSKLSSIIMEYLSASWETHNSQQQKKRKIKLKSHYKSPAEIELKSLLSNITFNGCEVNRQISGDLLTEIGCKERVRNSDCVWCQANNKLLLDFSLFFFHFHPSRILKKLSSLLLQCCAQLQLHNILLCLLGVLNNTEGI